MSGAKKCNRCGVLFEPKPGDLVITELNRYVKPKKETDGDRLWQSSIYDEDGECDLCTDCTNELVEFLKPITRAAAE